MSFFDDPRYVSFLARTHPNLDLSLRRFHAAPTYIASINIGEPLVSKWLKNLIRQSQYFAPHFAHPRALFVGTPFERYENTSCLERFKCPFTMTHMLRNIALQNQLDVAILTSLDLTDLRIDEWKQAGFIALPSFPDMVVPIGTDSFAAHLAKLNQKTRESIRRNVRRFDGAGLALERVRSTKEIAATLYRAYRVFYERAKVRWHPHSLKYFAELGELDERVRMTLARKKNGEVVGFIVNFADGEHWQAGRIGITPEHDKKDAIYFRLLYHVLDEAIANGAKTLSLEPTGYRVKRRLGAEYKPLVNLVLGVSPMWRMLLAGATPLAKRSLAHLDNQHILENVY